jgi:hypothetical protein
MPSMLTHPPPPCTLLLPNATPPAVAVVSADGEGRGRREEEQERRG